jgi:hypothetical protein
MTERQKKPKGHSWSPIQLYFRYQIQHVAHDNQITVWGIHAVDHT